MDCHFLYQSRYANSWLNAGRPANSMMAKIAATLRNLTRKYNSRKFFFIWGPFNLLIEHSFNLFIK